MSRFAWSVGCLALLLGGCATKPALAPAPVAGAPRRVPAVVVGARPLAPAALAAPVLQTLSVQAEPSQPGSELVVQTADGRTLSCIARGAAAPRVGATVLLQAGPDCGLGADVATGGAIR